MVSSLFTENTQQLFAGGRMCNVLLPPTDCPPPAQPAPVRLVPDTWYFSPCPQLLPPEQRPGWGGTLNSSYLDVCTLSWTFTVALHPFLHPRELLQTLLGAHGEPGESLGVLSETPGHREKKQPFCLSWAATKSLCPWADEHWMEFLITASFSGRTQYEHTTTPRHCAPSLTTKAAKPQR